LTDRTLPSLNRDETSAILTDLLASLAAIGGIKSENIRQVIQAGADSACLISAVLGAQDPQEAARQLINKIEAIK